MISFVENISQSASRDLKQVNKYRSGDSVQVNGNFIFEPIPQPIFIPEFVRVSEILSWSATRLIISKSRFKEVIFEFWDQLFQRISTKPLTYRRKEGE